MMLMLIFFNSAAHYDNDVSSIRLLSMTAPFIFMFLLLVIFKSNKISAFVFLIIAIGTTIDPENISDYSGAIFFIASYHIVKKNWYAIVLIGISVGCLTIRSINAGDTISQVLVLIAVFFYIYAIYYFLIYKLMSNRPAINIEDLTAEENNMLQLLAKGLSQKEAAAEMDIKHTKAAYLIKQIKDKTGYVSLNQLFYDY